MAITRLFLLVGSRLQRVQLAGQLGFALLEVGYLRVRLVEQTNQLVLIHRFIGGFGVVDLTHVGKAQQCAHQHDEDRRYQSGTIGIPVQVLTRLFAYSGERTGFHAVVRLILGMLVMHFVQHVV